MAGVTLYDYQLDAVGQMKNGCILCGGVGSGKSRTSLAYYYTLFGGEINTDDYVKMKAPCDLYIITTAKKRDSFEWDSELTTFHMSTHEDCDIYKHKVVIDSWNNIQKYRTVKDAFFIFDEQRVVGYGAWTKSFLDIARFNRWILLSATPGDTWMDYMPVFIANGFYRNKTDFCQQHVVWSSFRYYRSVDRYVEVGRLIRLRDRILVTMDFQRKTVSHHITVPTLYDSIAYKAVGKDRWNFLENRPIETASELCSLWRRIVNTDPSKAEAILRIFKKAGRVIIYYNFDYELDILKNLDYGEAKVAEWNGHKHQPIPDTPEWVYLVQYNAGSEGWNCIKTDTIIFYSENYSYKMMEQASGRIDRLNTPFTDLYYYHLKSTAKIDLAIGLALSKKKKFNERKFANF